MKTLDDFSIDEITEYLRNNATKYFSKDKNIICCADKAAKYLEGCLSNETEKEYFGVLFLKPTNEIIKFEILSEGSLTANYVTIRKIIKKILNYNADSIVLCHNHPCGNTEPSMEDILFTRKIIEACEMIDSKCLDHIIIGNPGDAYIMSENKEVF